MTSVALALCAAISYAAASFMGGRASAHASSRIIFLIAQAAGVIAITPLAAVLGMRIDRPGIAWGAIAGALAILGTGLNFYVLSRDNVSITAPIIALATGLVTVIIGLARGESLSIIAILAITIGLGSGILLTPAEKTTESKANAAPYSRFKQIMLATLGGTSVGLAIAIIGLVPSDNWILLLVMMRVTAVVLLLPTAVTYFRATPIAMRIWGIAALVGLFFLVGDICVVGAGHTGELAIAGVIVAMNPAIISIAGWVILKEKVSIRQVVGVAGAFVGVTLFALAATLSH